MLFILIISDWGGKLELFIFFTGKTKKKKPKNSTRSNLLSTANTIKKMALKSSSYYLGQLVYYSPILITPAHFFSIENWRLYSFPSFFFLRRTSLLGSSAVYWSHYYSINNILKINISILKEFDDGTWLICALCILLVRAVFHFLHSATVPRP